MAWPLVSRRRSREMGRFVSRNLSVRNFVEYLSIRTSCLSQTCFILEEAQMEPEQDSSLTETLPTKNDAEAAAAPADAANGSVHFQNLGVGQDLSADPGPEGIYRGLRWIFAGS